MVCIFSCWGARTLIIFLFLFDSRSPTLLLCSLLFSSLLSRCWASAMYLLAWLSREECGVAPPNSVRDAGVVCVRDESRSLDATPRRPLLWCCVGCWMLCWRACSSPFAQGPPKTGRDVLSCLVCPASHVDVPCACPLAGHHLLNDVCWVLSSPSPSPPPLPPFLSFSAVRNLRRAGTSTRPSWRRRWRSPSTPRTLRRPSRASGS